MRSRYRWRCTGHAFTPDGSAWLYSQIYGGSQYGLDCRTPDIWEKAILWLLQQRKRRHPNHVYLATYSLRNKRSFCTAIDQIANYGERGALDARFFEEKHVAIHTENIRTFLIGPHEKHKVAHVTIDDRRFEPADLGRRVQFQQSINWVWRPCEFDLSSEKQHRVSGPINDIFFDGLLLVPGNTGTDEETFFNQWLAKNAVEFYRSRSGGVHRGGLMGENAVDLPVILDAELSEGDLMESSLLLHGTYASNSILSLFEQQLHFVSEGQTIHLSDKSWMVEDSAVFAVFPYLENSERYIAVDGGTTPDAICWGSHLDMQPLPDYLGIRCRTTLKLGFLGK